LSIQAWGLKAKLLEANALYDNDAPPLREIHPELSFLELGLLHVDGGKKIWRG
jgi:predicted RNase H-like nuclease